MDRDEKFCFTLAFACMVSSATNAAYVAPKGRYGGAGASLSIQSNVSPMAIKEVVNTGILADYALNGNGTMIFDVRTVDVFFEKYPQHGILHFRRVDQRTTSRPQQLARAHLLSSRMVLQVVHSGIQWCKAGKKFSLTQSSARHLSP